MDENNKFALEVENNISSLTQDKMIKSLSNMWLRDVAPHKWSYNFRWLDRPAIMLPNDGWAMQELIWKIKPDLIIEAGIAHGGSLIYYASILAMLDVADALENGTKMDPKETKRKVLGLDIDIRKHNKDAIEAHPMFNWIEMIEGSSVSDQTVDLVREKAAKSKTIMAVLDSNHTHEHVLAELEAYAPLVSVGSYCVVFDTIVEDMPADQQPDRPWGPGNSPKTAVWKYLATHPEFEIDQSIDNKLQITVAPDGFLKRTS